MIVFSQDKLKFVNSDRIDSFSVEEDTQTDGLFYIFADTYELGTFSTEAQAKKVLRQIFDGIVHSAQSYTIYSPED